MQIKNANIADENFSVSVSKSANEVVATYTKDETGMDLVIRLPVSYPLRPVDVDCTRSLGISEVKQRKWLMSMMLFVRNQVCVILIASHDSLPCMIPSPLSYSPLRKKILLVLLFC